MSVSNKSLLELNQFSSKNIIFNIGDTVRSYRCGFDNDKPFKNHFIEGVVIGVQSLIKPNDYLEVKWQIENIFRTF